MDSNLFHLQRDREKINDSIRNYILKLHIPDFMWLLNNQTNREIRTEIPEAYKDDIEDCFQVKVKLVGYENELIEVYYKTYRSVFVKPSLGIKASQHSVSTTPAFTSFGNQRVTVANTLTNEYTAISNHPYKWVNSNEWQFLARQLKSKLKDENKLHNDNVELKFEFLVCHSSNNLTRELPCLPSIDKEETDMPNHDQTSQLMNSEFSDVTVKSAEGDEFPAHKIFLISRSAVFKAHFEHNTVESKTNVVGIPFETEVLKELLSYIYTNNAPNIEKLSLKLLSAADFYQLDGLKKLCETVLESNLTVDNAIKTLELANLHKGKYLKRKCLDFIEDGLARDIVETEGWKKLKSVEAVKSIYECIVKK